MVGGGNQSRQSCTNHDVSMGCGGTADARLRIALLRVQNVDPNPYDNWSEIISPRHDTSPLATLIISVRET
jgi:hypothetical protein